MIEKPKTLSEVVEIPLASIVFKIKERLLCDEQNTIENSLIMLAASIKEHGLLSPIVVKPLSGGSYEKIAGGRRVMAARLLGWETIPAFILPQGLSSYASYSLLYDENAQREDLDALSDIELRIKTLFHYVEEFAMQNTNTEALMALSNEELLSRGKDYLAKALYVKDQIAAGKNDQVNQFQTKVYYAVGDFCRTNNISLPYLKKKVLLLGFEKFIRELLVSRAITFNASKKMQSIYRGDVILYDQMRTEIEALSKSFQDGDIEHEAFKEEVEERIIRFFSIFKHGSLEHATRKQRLSLRLGKMAERLGVLEFTQEEKDEINASLKAVESIIAQKEKHSKEKA